MVFDPRWVGRTRLNCTSLLRICVVGTAHGRGPLDYRERTKVRCASVIMLGSIHVIFTVSRCQVRGTHEGPNVRVLVLQVLLRRFCMPLSARNLFRSRKRPSTMLPFFSKKQANLMRQEKLDNDIPDDDWWRRRDKLSAEHKHYDVRTQLIHG